MAFCVRVFLLFHNFVCLPPVTKSLFAISLSILTKIEEKSSHFYLKSYWTQNVRFKQTGFRSTHLPYNSKMLGLRRCDKDAIDALSEPPWIVCKQFLRTPHTGSDEIDVSRNSKHNNMTLHCLKTKCSRAVKWRHMRDGEFSIWNWSGDSTRQIKLLHFVFVELNWLFPFQQGNVLVGAPWVKGARAIYPFYQCQVRHRSGALRQKYCNMKNMAEKPQAWIYLFTPADWINETFQLCETMRFDCNILIKDGSVLYESILRSFSACDVCVWLAFLITACKMRWCAYTSESDTTVSCVARASSGVERERVRTVINIHY